jgi:adenine-specific DNA-methyltransferase
MNKTKTPTTSTQNLGHSSDGLAQRQAELLALIRQTAPEVIADNQINVEKFKELIGQDFFVSEEHYELNWAGKFAARREIQKTSSLTLRPDPSNPPNAQHMLIEGENLEVLRVLQKSYYGKVKMIYIDPPYNTGNDSFVYPDDYSETLEAYQKRTGHKNEAGYLNKQSLWKKNSKESGQYHSAWLSMMYPRLYLARNLLRDDGVIFISIDDNEVANLKLLCNELFGAENFVCQFTREAIKGGSLSKHVRETHDFILAYAKDIQHLEFSGYEKEELKLNLQDDNGPYARGRELNKWGAGSRREDSPGMWYPIKSPNGEDVYPIRNDGSEGRWRFGKESMSELLANDNAIFEKRDNGTWIVYEKLRGNKSPTKQFITILKDNFINAKASEEIKKLFDKERSIFDFAKPSVLIHDLLILANTQGGDIVLDFFAGSGTTAHAVMDLNAEDGGNRQCICVQMPELLDADSEAFKAGYRTIADITRSRIEKVISKIKSEDPEKASDLACANFTLAPSNFKVWQSSLDTADALREQLSMFQSAEKLGASKQADQQTSMLVELLLKHGLGALGVHAIAKSRQLAGVTVHRVLMVDDKTMWLCFDTYTDSLKEEIVKAMPAQVVMLNSCFVGKKADEQLANLQLELAGLDIGLTVI